MKFAIVTWVEHNNYGTQLQAFSLQSFLNNNGFYNELLYDKPILDDQAKKIWGKNASTVKTFWLYNKLKIARYYFNLFIFKIKSKINRFVFFPYFFSQDKIYEFKRDHLTINYEINIDSIGLLNDKYDIFICGSDQIWSPVDINFNGYYYLDFVKKRKLSYAASFGTINIPDDKINIVKKWLKDYDAVSVREKQNAEQLSSITERNVSLVCDPTLLFDSVFWSDFCENGLTIKKGYILCYFLESKKWYMHFAKRFAKKNNLPLVLIPNRKEHIKAKICLRSAVDPIDFVSLIKNSKFVLTDSYHGSIFAIIFSKQFFCFKRFDDNDLNNQNLRIDSLFGILGLQQQIIEKNNEILFESNRIDYADVQNKLNSFRTESQRYLFENITKITTECEDIK